MNRKKLEELVDSINSQLKTEKYELVRFSCGYSLLIRNESGGLSSGSFGEYGVLKNTEMYYYLRGLCMAMNTIRFYGSDKLLKPC